MKAPFKLIIVFAFIFTLLSRSTFAQIGINVDNSLPDPSAGLDIKFTNKGFLPPRMTFEQRNSIQNPAEGLIIFCTNCLPNGMGTITIFQGSKWINPATACDIPNSPLAGAHVPSVTEMIWKWNKVPIASGYKWNTTNNYSTAFDLGADTSKTETGLTCWTTYSRYVWAYNSCGNSSATTLSQTTSPIPFTSAPTEGIHVSTVSRIIWNWISVTGAIGYKWNTMNDFNSAINMGIATTKTETGLTINTTYTRYVWAYNSCGFSTPAVLTQTTLGPLNCGSSITINHLAGLVAPVTKTVTYGIITNIPGEPSLCWLTQNLGASQQATTISDATEASAGWYFQFNRKQGYQYTTTRTPATTWISSINDNSDWVAAKDPCTIELGAGWRIPTASEWTNVNASGNWTNWNGPWNSGLKMHASGFLLGSNGSLINRGSAGLYWSSSQGSSTYGWDLDFTSSHCYVTNSSSNKTYGFSLRCVRDF